MGGRGADKAGPVGDRDWSGAAGYGGGEAGGVEVGLDSSV